MRQYAPLWNLIKENKGAAISLGINASLHSKIVRAIKKEKHKDIDFKAANPNVVLKTESNKEENILSIGLVRKVNKLRI